MLTEIIGSVGATCTTFALLPQVIKMWRTKQTKDVSLLMTIILSTGVFLWIIYGFLIGETIVWLANIVTFFFAFSLLVMKLKYRKF